MEVVENEGLDTVDVGVRHEDQALDLGKQGDGIRILTLDALEDELIVLLVPDSGDSAGLQERDCGLGSNILALGGIPGVLGEETGLGVRDIVLAILAVLAVLTVLTILTVLTVLAVLAVFTGSSKTSVLAIDEPVAVVTDRDDRTVLTVLTVLTVGTVGAVGAILTVLTVDDVVGTLVGGHGDTASRRGNVSHNLTSIDLRLEIGELLGQFGDLLVQALDVRREILLARHSSDKCGGNRCTSQEKFE